MSDRRCVVIGCHQTAAEGYFACQQHCSDDWGKCTTCGQPTGSADWGQDTCPRCAELAALERGIGRAYLECRKAADVIEWSESQRSAADVDVAAYRAALAREIEMETELDSLITRYRALLAANAEAARKE